MYDALTECTNRMYQRANGCMNKEEGSVQKQRYGAPNMYPYLLSMCRMPRRRNRNPIAQVVKIDRGVEKYITCKGARYGTKYYTQHVRSTPPELIISTAVFRIKLSSLRGSVSIRLMRYTYEQYKVYFKIYNYTFLSYRV